MTHSIDRYLNRKYNRKHYNCAHLVCEVFEELQGKETAAKIRAIVCPDRDLRPVLSDLRDATILEKPVSPCVVYMRGKAGQAHVGVFIRGRVLHIIHRRGVQFQPLDVATLGFSRVKFFKC